MDIILKTLGALRMRFVNKLIDEYLGRGYYVFVLEATPKHAAGRPQENHADDKGGCREILQVTGGSWETGHQYRRAFTDRWGQRMYHNHRGEVVWADGLQAGPAFNTLRRRMAEAVDENPPDVVTGD